MIFLPRTAGPSALALARELLEVIRETPLAAGRGAERLSASIGLVTIGPGDSRDGDDLVVAADEAMYAAKQAGRDRVEIQASPAIDSG